jgi:DNA polymerase-3 subunit alpha
MAALFSDLPEALANTVVIAERCQASLDFKTKHYPVYVPPHLEHTGYTTEERIVAVEAFLWQLCREGIVRRYTPERLAKVQEIYPDKDPLVVIEERLNYEMNVIVPKEMCDYLLIVWDFIHWAKSHSIPVGPGRGSGAGSIILYLIGVTDIEPLRFHLFFERFINPERVSYPDIDVDICMDRRSVAVHPAEVWQVQRRPDRHFRYDEGQIEYQRRGTGAEYPLAQSQCYCQACARRPQYHLGKGP